MDPRAVPNTKKRPHGTFNLSGRPILVADAKYHVEKGVRIIPVCQSVRCIFIAFQTFAYILYPEARRSMLREELEEISQGFPRDEENVLRCMVSITKSRRIVMQMMVIFMEPKTYSISP